MARRADFHKQKKKTPIHALKCAAFIVTPQQVRHDVNGKNRST